MLLVTRNYSAFTENGPTTTTTTTIILLYSFDFIHQQQMTDGKFKIH